MKKEDNSWIIIVFVLTFVLSIIFSFATNAITETFNEIFLFIILLLVMSLGILFDIIGTSTIAANEATFHSMNSRKVKGSKEATILIRNSNRISSICNDVVGDVCGIISGGLGAVIAISLSSKTGFNNVLISVLISAFISSYTVGGKAIFKKIALKNANNILLVVGKFLTIFKIK